MIGRKGGKKIPKGRRYTPEQIITKLREAEVLQNQGMSVEEAARTLEIAPQTYYRWRKWGYEYIASTQAERPGKREPPAPATIVVQASQIQQVCLTL